MVGESAIELRLLRLERRLKWLAAFSACALVLSVSLTLFRPRAKEEPSSLRLQALSIVDTEGRERIALRAGELVFRSEDRGASVRLTEGNFGSSLVLSGPERGEVVLEATAKANGRLALRAAGEDRIALLSSP